MRSEVKIEAQWYIPNNSEIVQMAKDDDIINKINILENFNKNENDTKTKHDFFGCLILFVIECFFYLT